MGTIPPRSRGEGIGERVLYIATRSAPLEELCESMRRDLTRTGLTVQILADRRHKDRRGRYQRTAAERRQSDRRRHREQDALARIGWARIIVD